jgi:hypothetical protein
MVCVPSSSVSRALDPKFCLFTSNLAFRARFVLRVASTGLRTASHHSYCISSLTSSPDSYLPSVCSSRNGHPDFRSTPQALSITVVNAAATHMFLGEL